jgi:hypothetical protein
MDLASAYYLGVTILLCALFAAIVARTYSKKERVRGEAAKYRMMDDDSEMRQGTREDTHAP